jgi:ABC-type ATPase involved in cell division
VEEHFATRVADALAQLATTDPAMSALGPEQRVAIARLIVQALHVAASPRGGVEEAVRHLVETASTAT